MTFKSEDVQQVCRCHATQGELSLKGRCEKTGRNSLYCHTHEQASIQTKGLEPSPCVLIRPRHLINNSAAVASKEKTADEKSASLQAQPVPTATCVLTCKILSPYVPPTHPHLPLLLWARSCRQGKTSPLPCQSPAGGPACSGR